MTYRTSYGVKVRDAYISKESLDDYMKDKIPSLLKSKYPKRKNN